MSDNQAAAYAASLLFPQLATSDPYITDHGGGVTCADIYQVAEDAWLAGYQAATDKIKEALA